MSKHTTGALASAMANAGVTSDAKPVETAPAEVAPMATATADDGFEEHATEEIAEEVSPLRQIITGYRIEEALAATTNTRKAKRKGDPTVVSRRLARVYYKVGSDSNPYWLGSPSTINAIVETFPDGSSRKRITISGPGAMVGDDTWYPSLALDGVRTKPDPEMRKMCEEIRREWIASREAAVKNGTAALAAKTARPDQVGAADLEALGLSDFDKVADEPTAAATAATK